MFEKFGEFDSAEEINRAAKQQLEQGDEEAIYTIAEENGIDKGDVQDYVEGFTQELTTILSAAVGKLEVESEHLKIGGILKDWTSIILQQCMTDETFCIAVRRKDKSLKQCMASLIKFAFENKEQVSDEIVNITKVMHNGKEVPMNKPLFLGIPNNAEAKKIIREYYLG